VNRFFETTSALIGEGPFKAETDSFASAVHNKFGGNGMTEIF